MSKIRKAHSVEIIDRRLRDCETAGDCDSMELVGIHDELSRVERKWIDKRSQYDAGREATRPLTDSAQLDARFDRLTRLMAVAMRRPGADSPEHELLRRAGAALAARVPLTASKR